MADRIIRLQFLDRRAAVLGGLAALSGGALACARQPQDPATPLAQATGACRLYPQATEGPYYFDPRMERSDITEGRPGSPLQLVIGVLGADCAPLAGARVDVWHCDAQGTYSGYAAAEQADARGQTFLRGWQGANASGEVTFKTIYPGWYPGRTPHIHLKIILQNNDVMTSQLYFPEDLNDAVFRRRDYVRPRGRDTRNANDGIFRQQGDQAMATISEVEGGHIARILVAVDPAARPPASGPGSRGGRRGPLVPPAA